MEQFTSQQVFRAVDDVVASLGYDSIKQKQRTAIVEAFIKDVFVSLPTGYEKSCAICTDAVAT